MTPGEEGNPIEILLVEDNPGDVQLTRKAFEDAGLVNNLSVVNDGVAAMEYLRQEGEYTDADRPDMVLLDLNLPRKSGEEVLSDIKHDDDLKRIPVVILTSSDAEEDMIKTYNEHANAYLTKPVDFQGFLDVVSRVEGFWISVVEFPPD
ncbi:response regulator [Haloglomus salinum]|jgi:chemotaxis family two-component system response regulator Rcp1|uniref:response regulator n=1 Tax=Haloglomus salinum TaxID=2962673 RepID=UPI0020CA0F1A|nr:response regulator [Haloglomus salinum]